jgi:hypothetical protein
MTKAAESEIVELGDIGEDMITGYRGVCVTFSKHITGCDRITLQAPTDKDGKIPDAYGFDVTTVKLVKKNAVTPIGRDIEPLPEVERKPGGPPTRTTTHAAPR